MKCSICPRKCGAERTETVGNGVCAMPEAPVLARAALHMWEEPPISGTRGSGTVFFSGTPMSASSLKTASNGLCPGKYSVSVSPKSASNSR